MSAPRNLRTDDDPSIARVLGRAFESDPVFLWVQPDAARRAALLAWLYAGIVPVLRSRGESWGAALAEGGTLAGVAVWIPPSRTPGIFEYARAGLVSMPIRCGPAATLRLLTVVSALEAGFRSVASPKPAWILDHLGVDPDAQGRGLGGRLLRAKLADLDAASSSAVLNTTKETNVRLYERFGFEVVSDARVGGAGGFSMWTMRRLARA